MENLLLFILSFVVLISSSNMILPKNNQISDLEVEIHNLRYTEGTNK